MSRYLGPKLRIIRKLGALPGLTNKLIKRKYPPGQHGPSKALNKKSTSAYVIRLQEKQKLRFYYGVSEKQLYGYVKEARRLKGATGILLLQLLEMRLDNIVYRLGLAPTIPSARQLVTHGHLLLNGKNVNIPSFQCKPKDIISVSRNSTTLITDNLKTSNSHFLPFHLNLDKKNLIGKINSLIFREDLILNINDLLVVEFYSRKKN
jgi:small subunit ribosomal protein S4